jgi:hypothetical protein
MATNQRFRFEMARAERQPRRGVTDPEKATGGVQRQPLPTSPQGVDLMAQGKILSPAAPIGFEARTQSMKQNEESPLPAAN